MLEEEWTEEKFMQEVMGEPKYQLWIRRISKREIRYSVFRVKGGQGFLRYQTVLHKDQIGVFWAPGYGQVRYDGPAYCEKMDREKMGLLVLPIREQWGSY
jgi:hypothetical protein